jgi:hypothetical protein
MSNRLGNDNYNRPKKTLQDKFTKEEIAEKLMGYMEIKDVEELKNLPLSTEIRYFSFVKEGGKVVKKFRLGGRLINKDNADKYIVLATGNPPQQKTWSVQVKDAEIYYKQNVEIVIQQQTEKINDVKEKFEDQIFDLKEEIKKLKLEKKEVVLMYNALVDKYDKLKKGNK